MIRRKLDRFIKLLAINLHETPPGFRLIDGRVAIFVVPHYVKTFLTIRDGDHAA
jgi:hypothetical protein